MLHGKRIREVVSKFVQDEEAKAMKPSKFLGKRFQSVTSEQSEVGAPCLLVPSFKELRNVPREWEVKTIVVVVKRKQVSSCVKELLNRRFRCFRSVFVPGRVVIRGVRERVD